MSYCINPKCPQPKNPMHTKLCQACGSKLLLRGQYRLLKALGQGGFGATFLAKDQSLPGQPVCVIKQLRPSGNTSNIMEMARELFEREAETLGKIGNHPQLPRLLAYFEEDQQFYLVQEYISGLTLQQEVKRFGPFSEEGAKQFLSEILPLIKYIHSQRVIHRDIKPANIIRREQDRKLVLIDFGAVKIPLDQTAVNGNSDTVLTNFAVGTPGFAAPEQMQLRPVYASDVHALGVTCIYLLTGKSPRELNYSHSTGEMLWQPKVQVTSHFAEVLKKMVEASVSYRYQSADDILRALDLEPYLDSLAQGLATQPNNNLPKSRPNSFYSGELDPISSPSSVSYATTKLAAAIRARRERQRNINAATPVRTELASSPKAKVTSKLNTEGILRAYKTGRRDFTSQNLSGLNLQNIDLSGSTFQHSKLAKTNLQGANLSSAVFGKANLRQANLRDANLGRAYFSCADLEGADLRGSDLSYAHLVNANLKGANLCGANLSSAKVTSKQLAQAKTNWSTVMPNGKRGFW
ncbi:MAG: protein kinase [Symploca sp. SIO2E9]|nr:protein kinase [Symploca sp. SIO2E9]